MLESMSSPIERVWLSASMQVSLAQLPPHYVLAARQHLPCLRHLAAADDGADTIGCQLIKFGLAEMLLTTGHFYRAGKLVATRMLDDRSSRKALRVAPLVRSRISVRVNGRWLVWQISTWCLKTLANVLLAGR